MPRFPGTSPEGDESARPLATATQFPKRSADSKLRSLVLLLLVVLSTLLVGMVAAVLIVIPVMSVVALTARSTGVSGIVPITVTLILSIGAVCAVLYLPILVWTWMSAGDVVLRAAAARPSSSLAAQKAQNVVAEVAIAAGIPTPHVRFIVDDAPNAMVVGRRPEDTTIALTPSLVDVLQRQQLQAVIAHEIAHVVNGDVRFKTFLSAILLRFHLLSIAIWTSREDEPHGGQTWRLHNENEGNDRPFDYIAVPISLALKMCGTLARVSGLAASRQRELLADYTAAGLTRDPLALAEALQILAAANVDGFGARSAPLAQLFIVSPHGSSGGRGRYADHPSLEERVAQLEALDAEMKRG
jgi:heat shock protein HtpX